MKSQTVNSNSRHRQQQLINTPARKKRFKLRSIISELQLQTFSTTANRQSNPIEPPQTHRNAESLGSGDRVDGVSSDIGSSDRDISGDNRNTSTQNPNTRHTSGPSQNSEPERFPKNVDMEAYQRDIEKLMHDIKWVYSKW
ncbi:unnamed protein product [Ambrosiozyma monospora]|uniref:Unnamed protein product n=1 Tax=Ambrosiozyma monospora TaxID=43982 RepID=A0ACB5UBK7_AMBMO|nr:unnamed protein product [Ambrosiozyma monospora]